MGHHQDGGAVAVDPVEELQDLGAGGRVELAGGLVGQEERRPVGQGPGDGDPLHFAAGELGGPVPFPVSQPDVSEQLSSPGRPLPPGQARFGHGQLDVLPRGQDGEEVEALEDEAQAEEPKAGEGPVA